MSYVLSFWYLRSPGFFWDSFLKTIFALESSIAIKATLQNISKPIFQDYTLSGRFIGFGFRLGRIIAGLFLYALVALTYFLACAFWLIFPLICLVCLVGSAIGNPIGLDTITP